VVARNGLVFEQRAGRPRWLCDAPGDAPRQASTRGSATMCPSVRVP
jgi:hypothetical protein